MTNFKSDFWNDRRNAENKLKQNTRIEALINNHNKTLRDNNDLFDIFVLANHENNKQLVNETLENYKNLLSKTKKIEIKCFLSNKNDSLDSYLEFHAGAGGTESQDWAQMIRRMYMKWALDKGYNVNLISEHKGDEAGIKSSIIKISEITFYGFLKKNLHS